MTLSDRIAVMYEGRIVGEVDAATAAVEEIGLMMAGGAGRVNVRIERRLSQPHWLTVVVPIGSLAVAFLLIAVVLVATGHDPVTTYKDLFEAAFTAGRRALADPDRGDAARLHRPLRRRRVPHEPLQHRRRGAALLRRHRRLRRGPATSPAGRHRS